MATPWVCGQQQDGEVRLDALHFSSLYSLFGREHSLRLCPPGEPHTSEYLQEQLKQQALTRAALTELCQQILTLASPSGHQTLLALLAQPSVGNLRNGFGNMSQSTFAAIFAS